MFTNAQYLKNECTHHKYYSQFVTPSIKNYVLENYSKEFLQKCYSTDKNLNNLGNNWSKKFDQFTLAIASELASVNNRINGKSTYSLCMGTCAIKAYMREFAELSE